MPVSRRMELLRYAGEHQSLIIEDDFENEFVYLQKPTPSLSVLQATRSRLYRLFFQAAAAFHPDQLHDPAARAYRSLPEKSGIL